MNVSFFPKFSILKNGGLAVLSICSNIHEPKTVIGLGNYQKDYRIIFHLTEIHWSCILKVFSPYMLSRHIGSSLKFMGNVPPSRLWNFIDIVRSKYIPFHISLQTYFYSEWILQLCHYNAFCRGYQLHFRAHQQCRRYSIQLLDQLLVNVDQNQKRN